MPYNIKSIKLLLPFLFLINVIWSQPASETAIEPYLMTEEQLHILLRKVQAAPILNENCAINNCASIAAYHDELYNLREDLFVYNQLLHLSKNSAKAQWEVYVNENIRNEDLKGRMQYNLAFKDYLSDFSASALDVSSIIKSAKSDSFDAVTTSAKLLKRLVSSLTEFDEKLEGLNETMKSLAGLSGASESFNGYYGKWKTFYSTTKYTIDAVKEAITIYKSIGNNELLPPDELLSKRVSKGANIIALVAQLLNMYSSYERNEMKKAIAEFEKVLKANESVQTNFYDKYAVQVGLIDQLLAIQKEVYKRYHNLYGLHLKCNGTQERRQRYQFEQNGQTFRKGLEYYRERLIESSNALNLSWRDIETCGEELPYQFVIKDGAGERYDATIRVVRVWDNKTIIDNKRTYYLKRPTLFTLLPARYSIEVLEGTGSDGSRVSSTIIPDVEIDPSLSSVLFFEPFGRLELEVVSNKAGSGPPAYTYTVSRGADDSIITRANSHGKVLLDLPLSISLNLNVQAESREFRESNIRVNPNRVKRLQFTLEDDTPNKSREYTFKILDGLGNERTAYLEIIRNSDSKSLYKEAMDSNTKFSLTPDSYTIKIDAKYFLNGMKSQKALLNNITIKDNEGAIELSPFGRVSLKVSDKEGKPQVFSYKFFDAQRNIVDYSFTSSSKEQIMDMDVNTTYELELSAGFSYERQVKKNITIKPKQINNLHYIFDDGKFEEIEKTPTESPAPISTAGSSESMDIKEVPVGWAKGLLFNSNDGACDRYKGKTLVFVNRNRKFYNLATGEFNERIRVTAGQKAQVAAPADGGHYRVLVIHEDGSKQAISFWYLDRVVDGWWFAAGCDDGTKPISSNCFNGIDNRGEKSYSECKTL